MVKEVLKRLQFNDLYAKAEKCFFEQSSIKYLGIKIKYRWMKRNFQEF